MILSLMLAVAAQAQAPSPNMLVSADWLIQHQRDPGIVLLHVGPRAGYDSAHIAGAQYLTFQDIAAPNDTTRPDLELPDPAFLDSVLEAKGVSDNSRIIIYSSDGWHSPSTRAYFTLYWAGLGDRTSLLDGGIRAFRARGGQVTAEITRPARGSLRLQPRGDVVVQAPWLATQLNNPRVAIIDARNFGFFQGNYPARPREPRPGRIPGAFNLEFGHMVDDSTGRFLPVPRVRELLASARADAGDTVVTYCHIGQQGTVVWFAARLAGFDAKLYDGSFTEWSRHTQYPVERP